MNQKRRILLVDDDPNNVALIRLTLPEHQFPHEWVVAQDGREALDYLFHQGKFSASDGPPPDLVLLDLKMPGVDGFEVLRALKANATLKLGPVVVMTSSDQEKDRLKSYQLGANAYAVKPTDYDEFRRAVQTIGEFWTAVNQPPPTSGWDGEGESPLEAAAARGSPV